ncbi:MAG: hypothetical protein P0120_23655 [Nitrospira sp.]|nr:hypothetical protein [Nitrospira sp.]
MSEADDRVYALLPVVHRQRDEEAGQPLKALLSVIADQIGIVEHDIERLYENWFIETCDDWVVPYLGDLVGYRPAPEIRERGFVDYERPSTQDTVFVSRREVANTLRYRRRKGSLALLELLANDIAGWPARAVEFYRLVAGSYGLKHRVMYSNYLVDLRLGGDVDRLNTPFDETPHTVDVRRLGSPRSRGLYNPTHVGIFVWRLKAYSVSRTQALVYPVTSVQAGAPDPKQGWYRFTFDAFGHDVPLYTLPVEEPAPTHIADEINLPVPIRRRALRDRLADYYGEGKSFCIWIDDAEEPLDLKDIVPTDLSSWSCSFKGNRSWVAVDPQLGRLLFAQPPKMVRVSYHYGFSADIGGGEYDRPIMQVVGKTGTTESSPSLYKVDPGQDLITAFQNWESDQPSHAVIEVVKSGWFDIPGGRVVLRLKANQVLHLRAANAVRPVIHGTFDVTVHSGSRLLLDGFLIDGSLVLKGATEEQNTQAEILLRHCTVMSRKSRDRESAPSSQDVEDQVSSSPSLELIAIGRKVVIESSIVGPVCVSQHEVRTEPIQIALVNSVIDSGSDGATAVGALNHEVAHAVLAIERSTILGQVRAHAIDAALNTIFTSWVQVDRRQRGEMRFCYVPPESRTPSRHQCQPDLAEQDAKMRLRVELKRQPTRQEVDAAQRAVRSRIRPSFTSQQYGTATYCQLSASCPQEIVRGADDEGEMGVFHDLHYPQRLANLEARLNEYIPAGMESGIIVAS